MTDHSKSRVAAIVLAAGRSTRFLAAGGKGASKLVAPLGNRPLVVHAAQAAIASRASPIVVVTGHAREEVITALSRLSIVEMGNPLYASGLASSLKAGIGALSATAEGALILLGDMPLVSTALLDRLIEIFEAHPEAEAVVPVHAGQRGNPVLIARSLFPAIGRLKGDEGARRILAAAKVIEIAVAGDEVVVDIDTPEGLSGLEN